MNSIKGDLKSRGIIKITLSQILIAFVLTISPGFSNFGFVEKAEAASLTQVTISPSSNLINGAATYDMSFRTATTGTIKEIQFQFPSSFDLSSTRLIDRSGIGSGSLSVTGTTLKYTLGSAQSITAGTTIKFEVGRIVATSSGVFTVSAKTLNSQGGTIDGPTNSGSFTIKSIERLDISPQTMVRKTLDDNTAGHAHGWDPNGVTTDFTISDNDIEVEEESGDQTLITLMLRYSHGTNAICMVNHTQEDSFLMNCNTPPANNAQLHYETHRLAANLITSSLSSSQPSPNDFNQIALPY